MPPKKKKTIQDIKPSRRTTTVRKRVAKTKEAAIQNLEKEGVINSPVKSTPKRAVRKKKTTKQNKGVNPFMWVLVAVAFVLCVVGVSYIFSGAAVRVTPTQVTVPDGDLMLQAKKNSTTALSFQTITISGDHTESIQSDGQSEVMRPAAGVVTLYNNHSQKDQNLLIDTRLRGSNGLIYKTKEATKIPGQTKTADGELVPGSVDVEVYADTPGDVGNLGLSDFIIVGFEGTSKEDGFYGRGKTEITGGYTGVLYTVSEEVSSTKQQEVRRILRADLETKIRAQIPEGFIFVQGSEEYKTLETNNRYESDDSAIPVYEEAELTGIIIDKDLLAEAIAEEVITIYEEGVRVVLHNPEAIVVSLVSSPVDIKNLSNISVTIKGKPHIVWPINKEAIQLALVELRRKQFNAAMSQYEYVETADFNIAPFWAGSFPDKPEDIDIEIVLE